MATHPSSAAAPENSSPALLRAEAICLSFGGLKAVQNFSINLPARALYGLIGPNGAGKTTVFNLLTGVYRADAGDITLSGRSLKGLKPHQITAAGIARTFQNIRLFPDLSVLDNVCLAGQLRARPRLVSTVLHSSQQRHEESALRERCLDLLDLFDLRDDAESLATSLSYGHQRHLEIVRALATEPKVLLLDEPAAGLNSSEKRALAQSIRAIRDRFNLAILLIEHDMNLVMEICERIAVLDHGVMIAHGTPVEVQNDPKVIAAYLGTAATST